MKTRIVPYRESIRGFAVRYSVLALSMRADLRGPVSYSTVNIHPRTSANLREPPEQEAPETAPRSQKAAAEKQDKLTRTVA